MTRTLTTERQQFEAWFNEEMVMPVTESNSTAVRLMWKAWRASRELLANREAQPVAYAVFADNGNIRIWSTDKGITENVGVPVPLYTAQQAPEITDEAIDKIVVPLSPDGLDEENYPCEWHLYHDRERIRKELREYFATPPAPAVPDEISSAIRHLNDTLVACNRFNYCADAVKRVENACRAAMLAQPVSQRYTLNSPVIPDGWKLVPIDATRAMIDAAQMVEEDGYDAMHKAMLTAAPEGGNG